jgi:hypothetical protein
LECVVTGSGFLRKLVTPSKLCVSAHDADHHR